MVDAERKVKSVSKFMSGVELISEARLNTFRAFASDDFKALELHNMTLQVGSSLMAVIALIELALRNVSSEQIARDFGKDGWLLEPPETMKLRDKELRSIKHAVQHAKKAQYAKLSYREKQSLDDSIYPNGLPANIKHETLSKKRIETFDASHGQVIAQTTIFFWKRLYSGDYDEPLWRRSLKRVFPQKHVERSDVSLHLESLYTARNRVAHHDPVYGVRLDEAFAAVKFFRDNFMKKPTDRETEFQRFTEIQFHRLYIDYIAFKKGWSLLED